MIGAIQIKRPDVTEDVRELAQLTGVSITDAIAGAVRAQLVAERTKAEANLKKRLGAAKRGLAEIHRLPVVGSKLADEELYDADGLPK